MSILAGFIASREGRAWLVAGTLVALLVGCDAPRPPGSLQEEPSALNGVVPDDGVRNGGAVAVVDTATIDGGRDVSWQVQELWRIGGVDAEGPEVFGSAPLLVAFGPDGHLYVFDGDTQEIRVFGQRGQHLRTFGSSGRGPGEFEGVRAMGWDSHARLWLADITRYSVFDSSASLTKTIARPVVGISPRLAGQLVFDESGALIEEMGVLRGPTRNGFYEPFTGTAGVGFIRVDTLGVVLDTLPGIPGPEFDLRGDPGAPAPPPASGAFLLRDADSRGLADLEPFVPTIEFWTTSNAIWHAESQGGELARRQLDGTNVRTLRLPRVPDRLSSAEERLINDRLRVARRSRDDFAYGRQLVRGMVQTEDDYLLVLIEERAGVDISLIDVFDGNGVYVGAMRIPSPIDPSSSFAVRGNTLVAVTRDALDVKAVAMFAIHRSDRE